MKIYTKTGDEGTTSLLEGTRVSKAHVKIEAYGTVDELNAHIGLLRDQEVNKKRATALIEVQNKLFVTGSILASDTKKQTNINLPALLEEDVYFIENQIDTEEKNLPPMRHFVLPGGHASVSQCHIARCVCRRAERKVIALSCEENVPGLIIKYLNRLSDYLFVLARATAKELDIEETVWKSNG